MFDVVIVGAGPAGLSAALMLGRCRRNVLVCDNGNPRNASAHAMHGFLSRDGISPTEFLRIGREQLATYPNVELRTIAVIDGKYENFCYELTLADGTIVTSRTLLIATGVIDELPHVAGMEQFFGTSIFNCPYCHAWEVQDQPIAVYGRGKQTLSFLTRLTQWSHDLVLCTDGPAEIDAKSLTLFSILGIVVRQEPITRVEGHEGQLERIVFANGDVLPRKVIFYQRMTHQHSDLATKLGYKFTHEDELPYVPGLFVAGDASRSRLVVGAAASGTEMAVEINTVLLKEDVERKLYEKKHS